MAKVIVVYDSPTGLTEIMAKAIVDGARSVEGVEVELLQIGERFSIRRLESADAIVFGSPNIYNSVTPAMKSFFDNLNEIKDYLRLSGKISGAFESYGWDKGQVIDKINSYLESFDMTIVTSPLSIAHKTVAEPYIDEKSIQQCKDFGRTIAEQVAT